MKSIHYMMMGSLLLGLMGLARAEEMNWLADFADINTGDTAWIMMATALVMLMTIPGLALFYAGMVRKKNLLATMLQSFAITAAVAITWMVIGYSLAFTPNNGVIGGLDRVFLHGMDVFASTEKLTIYPGAATIPEAVFMLFQMAFATISAAIIAGSLIDRIKFSALLCFTVLWLLLVYVPTAHWVWEGGGWLADHGVLDFAGGTVVHINAGVAGLMGALILGKRMGYGKESFAPSNLSLTLVGAALLWVGWFGFNGGSSFAANGIAALAMVNTHVAAAVGALVWLLCEVVCRRKPSALGFASGALSGLVAITPAAGLVSAQSALIMGILTTVVCFYAVTYFKNRCGYDDSLDAFGIHGIGGVVGAILTGLFVSPEIAGATASVWTQTVGVLVTLVYSSVVSGVLFYVLHKTMGLRVSQENEYQGLDLSLHGERIE